MSELGFRIGEIVPVLVAMYHRAKVDPGAKRLPSVTVELRVTPLCFRSWQRIATNDKGYTFVLEFEWLVQLVAHRCTLSFEDQFGVIQVGRSECTRAREFLGGDKLCLDLWQIDLRHGHIVTTPVNFLRCKDFPHPAYELTLAARSNSVQPANAYLALLALGRQPFYHGDDGSILLQRGLLWGVLFGCLNRLLFFFNFGNDILFEQDAPDGT